MSVRTSFFVAIAIAIVFIFGFSTVKETYRGWKVDQEIHGLEAQVQRLEQRKLQLSTLVQALQSDASLDKQARQQLGLQKPGERVFVLNDASSTQLSWVQTDVFASSTATSANLPSSNPVRWFHFFFVH